jgi:X-X-X-Leu-X-X-Gly heptad repeat protein
MNRTLLLILCDFLLLNLLALTRWEKAEPARAKQPPVPELAANAATKDQDLVAALRDSLADEKTTRDQLAEKLNATDATLAAREQSLVALQSDRQKLAAEKNTLATTLSETQRTAIELGQKMAAATQDAALTKEQLAQLQRELAEKRAEAERQKQALAAFEKQQADARKQIEGLTLAVVVGEQEKKSLRETADSLKSQVQVERQERAKVQETATQLAQGVGQLAEKSGELTKEIRDNRPINANVLFNDFLANRIATTFTAMRKGFLGPVNKTKETNTVLVSDGRQIFALLHAEDTVFPPGENNFDWEKLSVEFAHPPSNRSVAGTLNFLAHDPRVVVIPVDAAQAAALGTKVFSLAVDPFKFPEAVLISGGGKGYGEVGFKLDASQSGFVRVDNRLFKRLFGDFAPSRGDLVISKTGELLGIMVNSDYCAVLKDFTPFKSIRPGDDILPQQTGALLDSLMARIRALPLKLQ